MSVIQGTADIGRWNNQERNQEAGNQSYGTHSFFEGLSVKDQLSGMQNEKQCGGQDEESGSDCNHGKNREWKEREEEKEEVESNKNDEQYARGAISVAAEWAQKIPMNKAAASRRIEFFETRNSLSLPSAVRSPPRSASICLTPSPR